MGPVLSFRAIEPDTRVEFLELQSRLARATDCLTMNQVLVIYSRYWGQKEWPELAELFGEGGAGWRNSCVFYHHRKALDRMRKALFPLKFKDLIPS